MGKVSDWVQALFRDFPNTASVEQVHLEMLNVRGNVVRATNRKYCYLFLARH